MTYTHDDSVSVALTALERVAEYLRSEIPDVEPEDAASACARITALRDLLQDCLDLAELQVEEEEAPLRSVGLFQFMPANWQTWSSYTSRPQPDSGLLPQTTTATLSAGAPQSDHDLVMVTVDDPYDPEFFVTEPEGTT